MALPSTVTIGSVALVVAAGVGLVAVASNAADDAGAHGAAAQQSSAQPTPSTTAPSSSDASTPDDTTSSGPPTPSSDPTPQHKPKHHRPDPVPTVFVEVYNNSGITGLAAQSARVLERAGWNVAATDNWYGNIPDSTVYYPDQLKEQGLRLSKVLHITRLRPAVSPMQFDRLTVILVNR